MLNQLVHTTGSATALLDDNRALSYDDLRRAVVRAADSLRRYTGPDAAIVIATADPMAAVISLFAARHLDIVAAVHDVRSGHAQAHAQASRIRARAIAHGLTSAGAIELEECPIRASDTETAAMPEGAALVLATSGSSAAPKDVVLGADGITANVDAIVEYLPIERYRRTGITLPLCYSYSLIGQVLTTLRVGATAVFIRDAGYPGQLMAQIQRHGVNGISSVSHGLAMLSRTALDMNAAERPALGYLASAGGPLHHTIWQKLLQVFPQCQLWNQYGLTEASPRVAAICHSDARFAAGSVGRPLRGISVVAAAPAATATDPTATDPTAPAPTVVDPSTRAPELPPLAAGALGEITVCTPSRMLAYLGDPHATADVFAGPWLRTRDMGYVDSDGYLFVQGRRDDIVNCAGERISTQALAAEMRNADGVSDVVIIAVPDVARGAKLYAVAESRTPERARTALRAYAHHHLSPARRPMRVYALPSFPRRANGKIDRPALERAVGISCHTKN